MQKTRYSEKRSRGNQMYGPGCCGHTLPNEWTSSERKTIEALKRHHDYRPPRRTSWLVDLY